MGVKVFRPKLDDVERLSHGKGAKKQRGTGSRHVCHRLHKDERKAYELAKLARYLVVRGTGYRRERKGSPLCNTFRQRCDALGEICVVVGRRAGKDAVTIDFSTLRVGDDSPFVSAVLEDVLGAKYPDLYESAVRDGGVRVGSDGSIAICDPIDWSAVRTKPIWGVNERLITVTCDRDIAKALAVDVLKESSKFGDIDVLKKIPKFDNTDSKIMLEALQKHDIEDLLVTASTTDGDNDDIIDWNDI